MIRLYGLVNTELRTFGIEAALNPGDVLVVTGANTLQSVSGYFNQSAATVTPTLVYANGAWQELTNASCTGFHMPTDFVFTGQKFEVTNSTGTDLATGDYAIPNGSNWKFGYNGSSWVILSIS